jgi:hypothetical protein
MTTVEATAERRQRIEELETRADYLMKSDVHTSVKADAGQAIRDLREATAWLDAAANEPGTPPAEIGFADSRIDFATQRLDFLDKALSNYGPTLVLFK